MILEDEQIVLRPFEDGDVPAVAAACRDPEIARWTAAPSPYTEEDARAFVASRDDGDFAIVQRDSGAFVGSMTVKPEGDGRASVHYWIAREGRGAGIAPRAVRLAAEWALRERGFARLELIADVRNEPSQRVAVKARFQREGILRSYVELKGERRDVVMFSLLREDL